MLESCIDRRHGKSQWNDQIFRSNDRFFSHVGKYLQSRWRSFAESCFDSALVGIEQVKNALGRSHALIGDFNDTAQEKADPFFPIPGIADILQLIVIFIPSSLEPEREIKNRLFQNAIGAKQERNEQPPDAAIAIQKWMDGFKLHMGQRSTNENRQAVIICMKEFFESAEAFFQLCDR